MMAALALAVALQTSPGAQVMGPGWVGQRVDVRGPVIAVDGACYQVAVERNGINGAGGRLWACSKNGRVPDLGVVAHVRGTVTDTRMTRMGPRWMVVPVVQL